MKFWYATPNFFKLYGIKIIEGSIPSFEGEGNRGEVLIANRAAMKALHYDNLSVKSQCSSASHCCRC